MVFLEGVSKVHNKTFARPLLIQAAILGEMYLRRLVSEYLIKSGQIFGL